jgi:outer membrane receptor protein involved in Fe transport
MSLLTLCTVPALSQDSSDTDDEVFELSPFEVKTTGDGSYYVSDTLAGNRLRTNMKDVGASLTQVSRDFMDDFAATDMMDMADFLPSVEAVTTQEGGPEDINGAWRPQRYRIRGLFTETTSRNYFANTSGDSPLPSDTYNMDRATVAAGANSILFGAANPAGIINYSTVKPLLGKDFNKVTLRTDNYGTQRMELHTNQSIMDDKAGVRIAYLN